MGKRLNKTGACVLAVLLLLQSFSFTGGSKAQAAPDTPREGYESTVPTPQNSSWINPDYNRDYDDLVVRSDSGLVHPGYYISREDLNVMRDMIWQGMSPWKESFEVFRNSAFASLDYVMSGPFTTLTSDRETYALIRDGNAAYNLSLMWYITGNDAYSEKAKSILNSWASTLEADPKRDIIRNGGAGPLLVLAAEILRYTPSSGWGSETELANFERMLRLLIPGVDRTDGYFNQGNFGTEAYMAIAIYLDDLEMYKKAVERVVHNKAQVGVSGMTYNHSINAMILPSGQQVEMGRDIPHAQDSMRPWAAMARTSYIQGTLVNEAGEFTPAEEGGVNLFEVHDQKLLKYAAYFAKYNLGSDVIWQPNINGTGDQAPFDKITTDGRGRIFYAYGGLVNYYKHEQGYKAEDVRNDPYMNHEDGRYLQLYGGNTYGSLYNYIDAAYEASGTVGIDEMLTTPWTVSLGQTGTGLPAAPEPADDSYELWNRIPGYSYTATGGTEGGVITEPFVDEDGVTRFATSNVKNGAWTAYTVDFDQFGSTPEQLADQLVISFGMNSNIGGSIDVRVGPYVEKPTVNHYNSSQLAGSIQVINSTWYNIFKTNVGQLTTRPELLTGKKTVYFYFYGSANGYNFHGNTMWFKFAPSTLAFDTQAADAQVFSRAASEKKPDGTVTLTNGGYIGFKNMDFDRGISRFLVNARTGGGSLKLVLGSPEGTPFKTYELQSTGELMRALTFAHSEVEQLVGRNGGNNELYLVYEGDSSITIDTFVAMPEVSNNDFVPVNGGSYTYHLEGEAVREEGRQGSVKLGVAPGSSSSVTYSNVDFKTGSPTLRIKVKSDTDARLRVNMLGNPVGQVAEYSIPKTDGLGEDGWITIQYNLADSRYETQAGVTNFLRFTASSTGSGTVELQDFLLGGSGDYPRLELEQSERELLLYPGATYENKLQAFDASGSSLELVPTSLPGTATYDAHSGALTWQVPAEQPAGAGYITLAATAPGGIDTSVFMVNYTVLGSDAYIARLMEEARALHPIAEALEADDYTPEGWSIIIDALNASQAIAALPSPTQAQAETAYYDLKEALDTVTPIPAADILGNSVNVTLNNGNTGQTAKNIISVWFDDKTTTHTEWQGSNQWAMFDFGVGTTFTLDRAKILARPQWGSRIAGVRIEGSNNGTQWTQLTDPAANTDALQKFFSRDTETAFRYIRVANSGGWYANLSELRLYGTFTDLGLRKDIRTASLASNNEADPGIAEVGDTVTLSFVADNVLEDVNVVLFDREAPAQSEDGLNWKADFTVSTTDMPGPVSFAINYKDGWPVEETTDGTAVEVLEEPDFIEEVTSLARFIDSTPSRSPEATLTQVGYLFDSNIRTNSDFRGPGNNGAGWVIMDFEERTVQLSQVKLIARQDQLGRASGTLLQGSNDQENWTNLISGVQGIAPWQVFDVSEETAYRYLRLTNPGNWFGNLGELKLYGTVATPVAEVDDSALRDALADAAAIDLSLYTSETAALLEAAMSDAQATLEGDDTTQAEIDEATAQLQEAIEGLVLLVPAAWVSGTETARAGDPVELRIGATLPSVSYTVVEVELHYDPAALEFQHDGEELAQDVVQLLHPDLAVLGTAIKPEQGKIKVILGQSTPLSGDGEWFKLQGHASAGAEPGDTVVRIASAELSLEGESIPVDTNEAQHVIQIAAADASQLGEAIRAARTLHDGASEGVSPGQYPQGSKATLLSAIRAAEAVSENGGATQAQIDAALGALNQAVATFRASVIVVQPVPGDKTALIGLLQQSQALLDNAVEGSKVGQYAAGSKIALSEAIQAATAVRNQSYASQATIDQATAALESAVQVFTRSLVSLVPGATRITIRDLSIVMQYYGTVSGDSKWNEIEAADLSGEGRIDIKVLAGIARLILDDWMDQ